MADDTTKYAAGILPSTSNDTWSALNVTVVEPEDEDGGGMSGEMKVYTVVIVLGVVTAILGQYSVRIIFTFTVYLVGANSLSGSRSWFKPTAKFTQGAEAHLRASLQILSSCWQYCVNTPMCSIVCMQHLRAPPRPV